MPSPMTFHRPTRIDATAVQDPLYGGCTESGDGPRSDSPLPRRTSSRISRRTGGRPGVFRGYVHFLVRSSRCHRSNVAGVTTNAPHLPSQHPHRGSGAPQPPPPLCRPPAGPGSSPARLRRHHRDGRRPRKPVTASDIWPIGGPRSRYPRTRPRSCCEHQARKRTRVC